MTSADMRRNPLFMRNQFTKSGKYELPLIHKQAIELQPIELIACSDTKKNDLPIHTKKGVHFFVDDYRFKGIYDNPNRTWARYAQYTFLLSPDFSLYADMDLWRQLENVAKNRWCGAWWQAQGATVIPSISWGDTRSFDFCFDGVEEGSIVAVGMIGAKKANRLPFLRGYQVMLEKINPAAIICFGKPFKEMEGNLVTVDYMSSRKVVR